MKGCQIEYFDKAPQLVVFRVPRIIPPGSCGFLSICDMSYRFEGLSTFVRALQETEGIEQLSITKHRIALTLSSTHLADELRRQVVSGVLYAIDTYLDSQENPEPLPASSYRHFDYPPHRYESLLEEDREQYDVGEDEDEVFDDEEEDVL